MNEIPQKYNPADVEDKWYAYWLENDMFSSKPDPEREPYTIVIPPPNVTGVLHMGHMLNNTIQDILVRRARMQGKNALWVPGTDHASISTETKVIAKLASEGNKKTELTAAPQTRCFVRLGAHSFYYGRKPKRECAQSVCRPI